METIERSSKVFKGTVNGFNLEATCFWLKGQVPKQFRAVLKTDSVQIEAICKPDGSVTTTVQGANIVSIANEDIAIRQFCADVLTDLANNGIITQD
jgi:hypothetical protein